VEQPYASAAVNFRGPEQVWNRSPEHEDAPHAKREAANATPAAAVRMGTPLRRSPGVSLGIRSALATCFLESAEQPYVKEVNPRPKPDFGTDSHGARRDGLVAVIAAWRRQTSAKRK
jgi:hypothetical protein